MLKKEQTSNNLKQIEMEKQKTNLYQIEMEKQKLKLYDKKEQTSVYLIVLAIIIILAIFQQTERQQKYMLHTNDVMKEEIKHHDEYLINSQNDLSVQAKSSFESFKALTRYEERMTIPNNK